MQKSLTSAFCVWGRAWEGWRLSTGCALSDKMLVAGGTTTGPMAVQGLGDKEALGRNVLHTAGDSRDLGETEISKMLDPG